MPYATWELPLPFGPDGQDAVGGAAYDPATQRIFVCQYNAVGASPIIHVYRVDLPTAPPATYAAWRAANFTGTDLTNDAVSGPDTDPDRCGLSNFARYAFDLPARGPVADPVRLGTATEVGSTFLTLTFPRRATAQDLAYTLESSPDLRTWLPVEDRTFGPGPSPKTAGDVVPTTSESRRFLRLRLVQAVTVEDAPRR